MKIQYLIFLLLIPFTVYAQSNHIVVSKGMPAAIHLATAYYDDGKHELAEDYETGDRLFVRFSQGMPKGLSIKTSTGYILDLIPTATAVKHGGLCLDNQSSTCFGSGGTAICLCGGYTLRTLDD